MTTELTVGEYRDLMSSALPSAQDADTVEPSLSSLFTPDSHRAALHVDATVVRGGRGVGKTFWYRSLLDEDLRTVAANEYRIERLRNLTVHQGYGAGTAPELYPSPGEMSSIVEQNVRPYDLWNAVLLTALGLPELTAHSHQRWEERVQWVRSHPSERDHAIAQADRQATEKRTTVLILFDALEHLHWDRAQADRLVAGILQLALEMRLRTKSIRFKVFIRPDMFDGALLNFPDASKLTANAASLQWSRTNLYGLFFHYLGNDRSQESARFRELTGDWTEHVEGRHLPPSTLRGDESIQADTFSAIAGPYMGANYRKGITYTWLPNHLMDGVEQVSPRSFLNALVKAVEETRDNYAGHEYALNHEGIRRGVQSASQVRVTEMREDIPWVNTAVEPLRGQQVPIDPSLVLDLWAEYRLTERLHREVDRAESIKSTDKIRTGPRYADDPQRLIDELITLGVMRRRKDGRIDLPDVYRIAFSIGRKGGVPMVQI
ncbi:hypothetical protein K353_06299 [Kitasatospora sp. SolWspMP-SS2h]|uniref:hypothetical protein n=1 Tax=Kitasatospora sp. SolWspMP-SS2h TaxID=1305729 RepID=UPI000DB9283E|nr:hypothetical protein [Kitasatospora sp. SolWspMP-SS2h]RAJ31195.1 hypothetical protein K353_06299 [Kitasatospora sp. SolWspMP-SS2h]